MGPEQASQEEAEERKEEMQADAMKDGGRGSGSRKTDVLDPVLGFSLTVRRGVAQEHCFSPL